MKGILVKKMTEKQQLWAGRILGGGLVCLVIGSVIGAQFVGKQEVPADLVDENIAVDASPNELPEINENPDKNTKDNIVSESEQQSQSQSEGANQSNVSTNSDVRQNTNANNSNNHQNNAASEPKQPATTASGKVITTNPYISVPAVAPSGVAAPLREVYEHEWQDLPFLQVVDRPVIRHPDTILDPSENGKNYLHTEDEYKRTYAGLCPSEQPEHTFKKQAAASTALGLYKSKHPTPEYFTEVYWNFVMMGTISGYTGVASLRNMNLSGAGTIALDVNARMFVYEPGQYENDSSSVYGRTIAEEMTTYFHNLDTQYKAHCPNN